MIGFGKNGRIHIGNDTMIAAHCYIIDMDHGVKRARHICEQENSIAPVYIGNDVWIAAGVNVLKGTIINDGTVIGAGAVVKGCIETNE